ncbi:MAG: hypothetical protein NVS1B13_08990 [Flavisolibacter sp.]
MKKIVFPFLVFLGVTTSLHSQFLDKLKNKVKQKVDQRIDNKTDKGIDKTLDKVDPATSKSTKENNGEKSSGEKAQDQPNGAAPSLKSYSRYDFVPGNRIIYSEDFSQDVIGEFPLNWNTSGSGEIVSLENLAGKWLTLKKETKYVTGVTAKIPENATIEFDLLTDFTKNPNIPPYISFLVYNNKGANAQSELEEYINGIEVMFRLNTGRGIDADQVVLNTRDGQKQRYYSGDYITNNVISSFNKTTTPVHVALWLQKQRIRVWLNEKKVLDAPKAIPTDLDLNHMRLDITGQSAVSFQYYVSNFKVAEATPDSRSKLLTEGKWSTNGILFDVNSDQIKPVSAGTLREIATTLKENPSLKVKIIGHTDSDGDAGKNLDLSKRRAAAVKRILVSDYNIEPDRLDTGGMGGNKPVADNKTPEGKAQNRRVEFIKI